MNDSGIENRFPLELSENAKRRRDAILDGLQLQLRSIRAKRKRRRRVITMASLVLVGLLVMSQIKVWNSDQTDFQVARNSNVGPSDTSTPTERNSDHMNIVRNKPGVLERYVVDNTNLVVDIAIDPITDDELIEWMQLAGKPAFLGRIDGQLRVIEY